MQFAHLELADFSPLNGSTPKCAILSQLWHSLQKSLDSEQKYVYFRVFRGGERSADMTDLVRRLWSDDAGQDIAEYAVMLAVILVLVVGTIRLIGSNANNVFSNTASSLQ
jgi:Flp pilus assembly pilin Flp